MPEVTPGAARAAWRDDHLATGTNAFRATRRNVRSVRLAAAEGLALEIVSDGTQHTRAWISGDAIALLVAEYVSPGSENFLGSHWKGRRRRIETGDTLRGNAHLRPHRR